MMIELLLACVCACLAAIAYRIWELNKTLKEIFVVQETAEELVRCKGNKERTVYMDEVACMLLGQYLETRQDSEPALFVGKGNRRLHPGGVRAMLNKLGAEADVDHVHPHKFRRTLATNMARHGMPVQEVAAILGHEKIDTTMKYVVLNKDDIKSSYRRFA